MRKHINKLALSSKRYYSFIENIVKETRAYFENADEGYTILCANYLNEDRFDEDEKLVLSVFDSDDISNQIFIYGAVCLQPYQETDSQLVTGLLITDERIFVRLYVTDDQEHDFEYYYYCEWNQLASVKKEKDEDGDDFIVLIDNENEEVGYLHAQLLGCRYDNMKISSLWVDFLKDAIHEANKQIKKESSSNVELSTKEKQVVKEQLISGMVEQLKQFPNREERVVQNNEEPKEKKVVRESSTKAKHESLEASLDKNKPSQSLSSKDEIKKTYKTLHDILQSTQLDVFDLNGVNSQFNTVKEKIAFAFDSKIKEAKKELDVALKDTVWDNLVIAFFGETNAGKSTIIETFRILFDDKRKKEDGLIVGDGRHDFTKTYDEYHLSIAGHPFTLIDVPGIEGNEAEFKDVIKTALHKAHCVFYVQGHNKKPDRATAEKIKKYLGDWVKVYSIYNVRGGVSNYDEEEERETLITPGVLKAESLIRAEFKTILGDVYAGHVTLQGLLAMSAKASFSSKREDLIRGQQKLLKYFGGSADKVLEFSQFKTLTTLVEQKSSNFKSEIIEANKRKLISLAGKIATDIEHVMESQKSYLANLESNLRTINREVCNNSMDSALRNITNRTRNAITSAYGELKSKIFNLIDKEPSNIHQLAEQHQQKVIWNLENRIKSIVNEELNKVRNIANRKIKDLDGVNIKPIQFNQSIDLETEIDFSGAFGELDIDLADVLSWTAKTAGTAASGAFIGSLFTPVGTLIGAGVGAVVGGIAHACSGDGGKADARKSVSDAIGKAIQQAKNNVNSMLAPVIRDMDTQKRQLTNSVKTELTNIEELQETLDTFDVEISEFANKLKHKRYGRI